MDKRKTKQNRKESNKRNRERENKKERKKETKNENSATNRIYCNYEEPDRENIEKQQKMEIQKSKQG